ATVAIAIAYGNRGDARLFFGHMGVAVADPFAFEDDFKIRDFCFERKTGGELFPRGRAVFWRVSKGDQRRPDHVQMGLREKECASRVCYMTYKRCALKQRICEKSGKSIDLF